MKRISSRVTFLYKIILPIAVVPSAIVIAILTLLNYLKPNELFMLVSVFLVLMSILIIVIAVNVKRLYYDAENGNLTAVGYRTKILFNVREVHQISRYFGIFFSLKYNSLNKGKKHVLFLPKYFQQLETGMLNDPEDIIMLKNEIQNKKPL